VNVVKQSSDNLNKNMKKTILTILSLVAITICVTAQVNIPDANFKSYLIGNVAINANGDTEIQVGEAAGFTGFLFCDNLGITDLTGIEEFTGLTGLYSSNNLLTTLDLSNNTALTKLKCNDNNLSTLNLSNNTALTLLWCENNSLTTLDLLSNAVLEEVLCSGNDLITLDLSNNISLIKLKCYDNSLTALNLLNNTVLLEFICTANNLTTLDLSNNTALTKFHCINNDLTSLDLSNNTALIEFSCNDNDLTALNIANGNNQSMSYFATAGNSNLTSIQVDNVTWSTTNWTVPYGIDAMASFSTNCSLGINALTFKDMSIFPNPTTGVVSFNFIEQVGTITIYNLLGTKVDCLINKNSINMVNLPNGVYILNIMTANGKTITKKVIKK